MSLIKTWKHQITGFEGDCELFDVNIFKYNWNRTCERVSVKDPLYKQTHIFEVYTVNINDNIYRFAAGEFSNCVWGFYIEN